LLKNGFHKDDVRVIFNDCIYLRKQMFNTVFISDDVGIV